MHAAVYRGESMVNVEEIPTPAIGHGEILIRVEACGICHTDLKKIEYNLLTPRVVHTPVFDTTHMQEVMQASGIPFPELDKHRIFMMFDYAASQNWGRRTNGFHS